MKKLYTLLLLVLPFLGNAQTITQSDLPYAGLAWINAVDTPYTDAIPAGGTGQTWDLSGLTRVYNDTVGFTSPSGLPYTPFFPGSNLAAVDINANTYSYFTSNSNGIYVNGFVSDVGSVFSFNPSLLYVPVPFSYGSTRNSSARLVVDTLFSGTNYRYASTIQSSFIADGSGTLITPTGTYTSVIRLKETSLSLDTIYTILFGNYIPLTNFASQNTTYRFIKPGFQPSLVASIYADSLGQFATSAEYFDGQSVSVPTLSEKNFTVYPNPADKAVFFDMKVISPSNLTVFDETGKVVYTGLLNGGLNSIDVQAFAEGAYLYRIDGNSNLQKGKFIVRH